MSKTSRVDRIYAEVQSIIYEFIKNGIKPTTLQIQQMEFGSSYNPDSRKQKELIYGCIMRGRNQAIELWNDYAEDNDAFLKDIAYIQYYQSDLANKELATEDFLEFYHEMQHDRFGTDIEEIKKNLDFYPAIALIWKKELDLFSEQGNSFLISRNGQKASWYLPTFWAWMVRDFNLYERTLKILYNQLERGRKTKVLLPSGQPLKKVLETTTVVRAMLENNTVWVCSKCGTRNIENSKNCVICNTPQS
jgi:ribosomal protein L40E